MKRVDGYGRPIKPELTTPQDSKSPFIVGSLVNGGPRVKPWPIKPELSPECA